MSDVVGSAIIDVWCAGLDLVADASVRARREALLDATERDAFRRLKNVDDANLYALGHAELRRALSVADGRTTPEQWHFVRDAMGRPRIAAQHDSTLHFSMTRCRGFTAFGISRFDAFGIDVVDLHAPIEWSAVRREFFSVGERARIEALRPSVRLAESARLWALKEALAKARGIGVTDAFRESAFEWSDREVRFDPVEGHRGWLFHGEMIRRDTAELFLACAARCIELQVHMHDVKSVV